jgi:isoleucyl-tRNA synthetase
VTDIFNQYGDNIKAEVLAEAIHSEVLTGYEKEWNINGEKVTLAVEKC